MIYFLAQKGTSLSEGPFMVGCWLGNEQLSRWCCLWRCNLRLCHCWWCHCSPYLRRQCHFRWHHGRLRHGGRFHRKRHHLRQHHCKQCQLHHLWVCHHRQCHQWGHNHGLRRSRGMGIRAGDIELVMAKTEVGAVLDVGA